MPLRLVAVLIFIMLIVLGAGAYYLAGFARPGGNSMEVPRETAEIVVRPVVENLNHPWAVEFLPEGGMLITERGGDMLYIDDRGERTVLTGLPDVYAAGQGGLLDVVLAPDYKMSRMIYFSYAAQDAEGNANTEVARARFNPEAGRLEDVEVIFRALPKVEGRNHYGSKLLFDGNGHLFITLGERFDYSEEAQNVENHLGALIRLNADGTVPQDNPFFDRADARPEIYSYGHRNAQGIALHPRTGRIWLHEHGPRGGDEINIIRAGANYGWPEVSYGVHYSGLPVSDFATAEGITAPILQWTPSIAPSGMVFYSGGDFPEWEGDLFVGALAKEHLRRLTVDGADITGQFILLEDFGKRIRDVDVSPEGGLYVLTDERDGGLYRLLPAQ